jgi:hypothetical protein
MNVKRIWTIALVAFAALMIPQTGLAQTVTAAWTSATALDTAMQMTVGSPGDVTVSFNVTGGTITAGSLNFEASDDGSAWYGTICSRYGSTVGETSFALGAAANQVWACQVGGPMLFRVRLNPAITGTGTANLRTNVTGITSTSGRLVSLGNSLGKTNTLRTGSLVTTAATADQVVLTYTVTAGKTFYLEYVEMEGRLTVAAATATILGEMSLETPATAKGITSTFVNPTTSASDKLVIPLAEPIPIAAGTVIRVVVTPTAATSMTWKANFGGYEK